MASKLKILIAFIIIGFINVSLKAQFDSSKYNGGSFDGFSLSIISQQGLNGQNIDLSKYHGGSFDGFTLFTISQTGLNGTNIDLSKYHGGSFDGFTLFTINQTGLNGTNIDLSKYHGGSFDGFALFTINQTGLNGTNIDVSKYHGGSFDGFTLLAISQTGLNGQNLDLSKYHGGSFDGFASAYILITGLGGQLINLSKYHGGAFDGFAVTGTQLIPLEGGNLKLRLCTLIEGFYNPSSNRLIEDTVSVYLKFSSSPPYAAIDSAKVVPDSLGFVNIEFKNAQTGNYYIVIKHRNSIETWSKNGEALARGGILNVYDFSISQDKAYGNNMILKGTRWCIYSGDVNRDGLVDGTDLSGIDNDVSNFVKGYVSTDVNGDNLVDGSDLSLASNNAEGFVSVQQPAGTNSLIIINSREIPEKKIKNLNGK